MKTPQSKLQNWFAAMSAVLAIFLGFALVAQDASAKRLGGGSSFGRQSPNLNRQQASPAPKAPAQDAAARPAPPQTPAAAPQPARNRWLGPLAGIAAGLGIAALLSHFGMAGEFASALGSMLMIGLLTFGVFFLWRLFRSPRQDLAGSAPTIMKQAFEAPAPALARPGAGATNVFGAPLPDIGAEAQAQDAPVSSWNVPAEFDVEGFLRSAKVYFNRLQAAWDAKDLDDIRKFTTPEAFAEIKMQHDESAGKADRTEVSHLGAVLLGIETSPADHLASVRFSGTIRENGGAPESFEEIWNLVKPVDGRSGWLLAGVQQVH